MDSIGLVEKKKKEWNEGKKEISVVLEQSTIQLKQGEP